MREQWAEQVFQAVDVVLAPASSGAAPLLDNRPEAERRLTIDGVDHHAPSVISAFSRIPNLAMLPCTVVPMGLGADSGLPLGAQLIGPYLADRTTIRVAMLMEREGLVRRTPPPVSAG